MPIIKSAKKRVRTANKAAIRNSKTKRALKSALKLLAKSPTSENLSRAQSEIDTAAKKHVIHVNKAARLKSRVAASAKKSGVKLSASKKTSKATPAKAKTAPAKTTTKKAPAKATTTKKAPAKKPAAKK
jgi:DNA-binding protein HU-beta